MSLIFFNDIIANTPVVCAYCTLWFARHSRHGIITERTTKMLKILWKTEEEKKTSRDPRRGEKEIKKE